ncbi:MAG: peptide chain release factor 1 [candidate division Zixibacteria bacterium]|nr:peptide chain release factor 1 [candidate division Zixibacteria bacterium]
MLEIVEKLEKRLKDFDLQMSDPVNLSNNEKIIELSRERRNLEDILEIGREYRRVAIGMQEANDIIKAGEDNELVEMAKEELAGYEEIFEKLEKDFKLKLLPTDPNDSKNVIVEVRAGTGGNEAGLFTGEIFRMYQKFADSLGWKLDIMNSNPAGVGGFKEISFSLEGNNVFGKMKYESGVHRVQRVPETESQGRVHTSAISVAVLPEAEDVDIEIKENELKIDVYRSSGPGGQSVNTTDSAVRITYIPTGMVVTCQDEKSQIKNKAKALKVLRARLYDAKIAEQQQKIALERRSMISTGDRSAKIRTYNFPQSRVTDHRISLTLYRLDEILNGDVDLIIEPLRQSDQEKRLKLETEKETGV